MKHSFLFKSGLLMALFVFLLCCTHEEDSIWQDVANREIQSFFNVEELHSRSNVVEENLIQIIVKTLQKQEDLLEAVQKYKSEYGTPMWVHSKCISTVNGLQVFVPVYNEKYPDEIKSIWHLGIYDNTLYHFTTVRKPEHTLVEEFWKYDYFTIDALGKQPASGISFSTTESRAVYECVHASVTSSIIVDDIEYSYTDDKGWHCWEVDENHFLESITYLDGGDGGSGGGIDGGFDSGVPVDNEIGVGGGGGNASSTIDGNTASKAKAMFRNSNMTEENWNVIEKMLDKITENCMGQNLYNALLEKLNGKTLAIEFVYEDGPSFYFDGSTSKIKLDIAKIESNHLFHEMWHAYQAYQETVDSYKNALKNLEIEAHYAQYLYLKSLPEFEKGYWKQQYVKDKRHKAIAFLDWYLESDGELNSFCSKELLDTQINDIVNVFSGYDDYKEYGFDSTRKGLSNFTNLSTLTKDC